MWTYYENHNCTCCSYMLCSTFSTLKYAQMCHLLFYLLNITMHGYSHQNYRIFILTLLYHLFMECIVVVLFMRLYIGFIENMYYSFVNELAI